MITYDLTGKTALVTGSNRGIGKAMADALEAAGAKVIRTSSAECDLTDRAAVYAFVEKIKKEHQIDMTVVGPEAALAEGCLCARQSGGGSRACGAPSCPHARTDRSAPDAGDCCGGPGADVDG